MTSVTLTNCFWKKGGVGLGYRLPLHVADKVTLQISNYFLPHMQTDAHKQSREGLTKHKTAENLQTKNMLKNQMLKKQIAH